MKQKYDSSVVYLYSIGNENILPADFRKKIPYPTISTWRKTDYSQYIGHEFRYVFADAFTNAELSYRYHELKKGVMSMAKAWITLSSVIIPILKNTKGDKEFQKKVLNAIRHMSNYIGVDKTLKMLSISRTQYQQWILESRFDCFDSHASLCIKRHPHQLHLEEVDKIKTKLLDPNFDHWPIVSIASSAFRNKSIVASLCSWYKYAKIFNITKKLIKKERKTVGLLAKYPNEYLHVDTTFYPMMDGKEVCISFVMDNYSKMILGWHVAKRNNFEIVIASMTNALKVMRKHPGRKGGITMVTDGGKENHNHYVETFLDKLVGFKISKKWAIKQLRVSNSPVEAIHRTMKGRYLRNQKFESITSLKKYLEWAVSDYNKIRPHYKFRPKTPYEMYFDIPLNFDVKKRAQQAVQNRVKKNKCVKCIQCKDVFKNKKGSKTCANYGNCAN